MSTPLRPYLGDGGDRTHAAMMSAMTPDAPATLDRHEAQLADHDARISNLENILSPSAGNGDEVA